MRGEVIREGRDSRRKSKGMREIEGEWERDIYLEGGDQREKEREEVERDRGSYIIDRYMQGGDGKQVYKIEEKQREYRERLKFRGGGVGLEVQQVLRCFRR